MPTTTEERRLPTYREIATKIQQLSKERGEWAGMPTPMGDDFPMTIEPRHPYRMDECAKAYRSDGWCTVNSWTDPRWGFRVMVQRNEAGRARVAFLPGGRRVDMLVGSFGIMDAWSSDAETRANTKLWSMIGAHRFKMWTMTGAFLETSKRSGVVYIFRRLRPTVAIKADADGTMKILCTLCLHPIGYYHNAWGGCMVPTDEAVAHLAMMRGDEPKFWAHANQHAPSEPESGL